MKIQKNRWFKDEWSVSGVTNLDSFGDVLHGVEQNEIKCTVFVVRLFFICKVNQYMP